MVVLGASNMRMLIAEQNSALAAFLRRGMEQDGYEVTLASGSEQALAAVGVNPPAIAILDLDNAAVDAPEQDGLSIVRALHAQAGDTAIVVLTSRHDAPTRLLWLEAGADDVIEKPLSLAELRVRCRGLLRRRPTSLIQRHGALELNRVDRSVTRDGETTPLTNREFALLDFLLERRGQAVSRRTLLERVWNRSAGVETSVVDVYVNYLRRKLPGAPLIRTVRGQGYCIAAEA